MNGEPSPAELQQAQQFAQLQQQVANLQKAVQQLVSERDFYRLEADKARSARDHYRDDLMDEVARDLKAIRRALTPPQELAG